MNASAQILLRIAFNEEAIVNQFWYTLLLILWSGPSWNDFPWFFYATCAYCKNSASLTAHFIRHNFAPIHSISQSCVSTVINKTIKMKGFFFYVNTIIKRTNFSFITSNSTLQNITLLNSWITCPVEAFQQAFHHVFIVAK